ncbi:zinc transporter 2, partial [Biomphalaria glabrata]
LNSPDHHSSGLLSPQSLRFNPFNVSSSQSISESQDKRFDPLVFGDPTFISSYFAPTPDRDGAYRAWRRSPQDDGVSQAFGSHVSELTSSAHFTQSALVSHPSSPPVESRAAFISVPIQNVIIQDYTDKVGQALASKQHAATSTTNSNLVNPQIEIRGHPTTMTKVIDRGMAFNKALPGYAKPNPAPLRQQCLIEEDGGEDDSSTREDSPLLDSHLQSAPPTRPAGQAIKPSSRSRAARDEAADFSGCTSHDYNKQRDSDAIAADMTGHDGEKDSLKGYVRGKPTHNGSMDTNVVKQWSSAEQRRRSESEQAVALSVSYRHCHRKRNASLTDKLALRQLIAVVVLCLLFMTGEAVGGVLSNSLALFTDVLHLGSDLISFIISLLAIWLAKKPASKKMSFGYHRAEVVGALLSVFIIWMVSGILCYIAVERIIEGHYKDVHPDEMLITASLGVVFNFIMGFVLHSEVCCSKAHSHQKFGHGHSHGGHGHSHGGHGHSHGGHGHSHGGHGHSHNGSDHLHDRQTQGHNSHRQSYEDHIHKDLLDVPSQVDHSPSVGDFDYHQFHSDSDFESSGHQLTNVNSEASEEEEDLPPKHKNINVRAAFIHVVGDIIQSLGVLVAALIIKFVENESSKLADPICTFLFSVLVLITTITILRDTLVVVMEGVPRDISFDSLKKDLIALDNVIAVHSLHIWSLTLDRNALAVHLVIDNYEIQNDVLNAATKLLQDKYHFFHSTIQVDRYNQAAMTDCHECLELN